MIDGADREKARGYFEEKGLTYDDITAGDICTLVMILNKNIKKSCKNHNMSVDSMHMSEKILSKYRSNGKLIECYLFINSHYFTRRECISFNKDGFIGFCGWAGGNNQTPIIDSFMEWVDSLIAENTELLEG